jgi:hypothetical protein
MNKNIVLSVALLASGLGAGFFGGMKYQQMKMINLRLQGQQRGNRQGNFGGMGIRPIMGEVISIDGNTLTVKSMNGSSKIVLLADTTKVTKSETGAKEDIKTGIQVAIFGKVNQDGSVTADSVQLNPIFRTATSSAAPVQQ